MVIEEGMRAIVEQLQQLLACQSVIFLPVCSDVKLSHPLLHFIPAVSSVTDLVGQIDVANIWQEERVRALCDSAIQTGSMQMLVPAEGAEQLVPKESSIAVVPCESRQGILGLFFLVDTNPLGPGEENLLRVFLSMRMPLLEEALWSVAQEVVLAEVERQRSGLTLGSRSSMLTDQFVRSEFVSMVGHELRAPLSIIKGYAALLQLYGGKGSSAVLLQQRLEPEKQRHYLDVIVEQTNLLEVLVNDLLDIARLQRGQLLLRPQYVDIGALCQRVVKLEQVRADQLAHEKYRLECKLTVPLLSVWTDPERLQQILMNMFENAIKYSPAGGQISLEVALSEGWSDIAPSAQAVSEYLCFTIRDQGIGIPAQQIARLFQPFERLERAETAHIPGVGLGLYVTRKLVEAMGGQIELQSCVGSGTSVTIHLPVVSSCRPDIPAGKTVTQKVGTDTCS